MSLRQLFSIITTFWLSYLLQMSFSHKQIREYEESNGTKTFKDIDYMEMTPEWAVFGNSHRGFDPDETRWHRKKKKDISGC